MIYSDNRKPGIEEFRKLVDRATRYLNQDAEKRTSYYLGRNGQKLEDDVMDALNKCAGGTEFDGTIKKVSGQKFPDIVAAKYYGLEVKSSKGNKWVTLGGSVNESTREPDVERIFLLFGQLVDPVTFVSKPYEECISDVVVTHYPRYKIDMELSEGDTIFDKMGTTYDELRREENPVNLIVQHYKKNLREGESVWWIDSQQEAAIAENASMTVRLWKMLSEEERKKLVVDGFIRFPEILSSTTSKYGRFSLWILTRHCVVSTNTRDAFTAGGKASVETKTGVYKRMPKVFSNLNALKDEIRTRIPEIPSAELEESWKTTEISDERLEQWIDIVTEEATSKLANIRELMNAIFEIED